MGSAEINYSLHYLSLSDRNKPIAVALAQRSLETLLPYLPQGRDARILEIGPGNGLVLGLLRDEGYSNVEGWEVDRSLAEDAVRVGLPVRFVDAELVNDDLQAKENSFDLIFFMHVLEHISVDKQISFLAAVQKALKPNGVVVCEVPNADSPVAMHYRYSDWTHKCLFSVESLKFILSLAAFKNILVFGARPSVVSPRSYSVNIAMRVIKFCFAALSNTIQRIHLVAGFGINGLKLPVGFAIVGVGYKAKGEVVKLDV